MTREQFLETLKYDSRKVYEYKLLLIDYHGQFWKPIEIDYYQNTLKITNKTCLVQYSDNSILALKHAHLVLNSMKKNLKL